MESSQDVFIPYKVVSDFQHLPHPSTVVETLSLASIEILKPSYKHGIPSQILLAKNTPLSGVQMDAVLMVGESHSKWLDKEHKVRQGFMIGDGTGVGKGRELTGVILDNWCKQKMKAVWFSCSKDLYYDAVRDIRDLCAPMKKDKTFVQPAVHRMPSDFSPITHMSGILFCTYSMLTRNRMTKSDSADEHTTSEQKTKTKSPTIMEDGNLFYINRLEQIAHWLGKSFDGVIVFDEAHKAKGYNHSVSVSSSQVGKCVYALQKRVPKARIVYVSATMATSVQDMGFMYRLGLWGTPFTSFKRPLQFFNFVEKRGVAGCEIVACELKSRRVYLSRHLAYGNTEFHLKKVPSTTEMSQLYDRCCELWTLIIEITPPRYQSELWANCQKFFRAMCVAAKLPELLRIVREALSQQSSVVIGIQSTGEAAYIHFKSNGYHEMYEPFSPCRTYIEKFLREKLEIPAVELGLAAARENTFAINSLQLGGPLNAKPKRRKHLLNEELGDDGNSEGSDTAASEDEKNDDPTHSTKAPILTSKEGPVDSRKRKGTNLNSEKQLPSPEELEKKKLICSIFKEVGPKLSLNPLDIIQAEFGYDNVAEMTGRKRFQSLMKDQNGMLVPGRQEICRNPDVNQAAQTGFQDGTYRIAIISEAASTGISLHSSLKAVNQDQRLHIILEAPWTATDACQQMGRTNRADQVNSPVYLVLMSDIPGESRFASALAGRMESLAALCKGDRKSSSSSIWSDYEIPPNIAKKAIKLLLDTILGHETMLDLFGSAESKVTQEMLRQQLWVLHAVEMSAKGAPRPRAPILNYEKLLNRILCTKLEIQKAFLSLLEVAIDRVKDHEESKTTCQIKDLGSVVNSEFVELSSDIFPMGPHVASRLITFKKNDVFTWNMAKKTAIQYKTCKFFIKRTVSGNIKVRLGIPKHSGTPTYKIHKPSTKSAIEKRLAHFSHNGYTEIKIREAKQHWITAEQFFATGKCSKALSTGVCSQSRCRHNAPNGMFGVVVGGILTVWDNMEHVLPSPINFVRYVNEEKQILGIFVTESKLLVTRSTLESLTQKFSLEIQNAC